MLHRYAQKREHNDQVLIRPSDTYATRNDRLPLSRKPAPLVLGPWDTLTLSFGILAKGDGKGYQPHQTFLRFYDKVSGEEGIQPLRVAPGGRVGFELVRIASCRHLVLLNVAIYRT